MEHYTKYSPRTVNEGTVFTFDIETSSYWLTPTGVQGYTENYLPEDYNNFACGGVCYIWQFSIDDKVYYGRDLVELGDFLDIVFNEYEIEGEYKKPPDPIIWVHNLAWEFQFIREYIRINYATIFARYKRKPMSFKTLQYGSTCVEFRCSYMLTHLSLDAWGKDLGFPKLHTLDYTVLRTPLTKLTKLEMDYAERDCLVVYTGILKYKERYGSLQAIPKTQTGEVRLIARERLDSPDYHKYITKMLPKTEDEYKLLRALFQGGSTGGNCLYAGKVQYNVDSDDIQSDYPAQMCSQLYPCESFKACAPSDIKLSNFDKNAFILCLHFEGLRSKTSLHYYSRHKSVAIKNANVDNGKIISCDSLHCIITEQDLAIFYKCYEWDSLKVIACYKAKKDYLPKEYIEIILSRYCYKTTLKDVADKVELYAQSKQFINSCYGMMVTDLYQANITFNGSEWVVDDRSLQETLDKLQRYRKRNFLSYAWGCWVTAYARAKLWIGSADPKYFKEDLGMLATPNDIVYWDTDSRKHFNNDKIAQILKREDDINLDLLYRMCDHYGINRERVAPKDANGKARILGAWDHEGTYNEGFIHLGAKRYATKKDGKIEVTVSGVPKKAGSDMLKDLSDFKDGYIFDPNHRDKDTGLYDGKMLSIYCDGDNLQITLNEGKYDEYKATNKNSIVLRNNGYKLGLASDYKELIEVARERGFI